MPAPFSRPRQLLNDAVGNRITPCAVAEAGNGAGCLWREAVGRLTYDSSAPDATTRTIFDLASLTKVMATATMAMQLVDRAELRIDVPVCEYLREWRAPDRADVTIADLLEHAAGLPAVLPLYEEHTAREGFQRAICEAALAYRPRSRSVYSDLGFILLGFVLEDAGRSALGEQFDALVRDQQLAPDPQVLRFGPIAETAGVAATQVDAWRGRLLQGEVDDRNGAALGGVAGHTGLFGTVAAVGAFARSMLTAAEGSEGAGRTPASVETIRRFLTPSSVPGSTRALGWDTMRSTSSCGTRMSPAAFGHTGFTGTSLWIDPAADLYAVLLTNRVHPAAGPADGIQALRRAFHDSVVQEVTAG